jgi:hypothetical protein
MFEHYFDANSPCAGLVSATDPCPCTGLPPLVLFGRGYVFAKDMRTEAGSEMLAAGEAEARSGPTELPLLPPACACFAWCLMLALVLFRAKEVLVLVRIALLSLVAVASTVAVAVCCYRLNPERLAAPRHRANFPPPRQLPATAPTAPLAGAAPMRAAMPVV